MKSEITNSKMKIVSEHRKHRATGDDAEVFFQHANEKYEWIQILKFNKTKN